jgi:hypothetical protein
MKLAKTVLYDSIVVALFEKLTRAVPKGAIPDELPFDLDDVRQAMDEGIAAGAVVRRVKNIADIKYTYDARKPFPASVSATGDWVWIGNGKGKYKFVRVPKKNLINLPQDIAPVPPVDRIHDQTPPFISALLGKDEQATFTRIRCSNLLNTYLGFPVWQIQGHHRTTVSYGQIEVDEVYAGIHENEYYLVPISGKGGQDKLSFTQALNLNVFGVEKAPKPGMKVRPLGIWRSPDETLYFVEFSTATDVRQLSIVHVKRYQFVAP